MFSLASLAFQDQGSLATLLVDSRKREAGVSVRNITAFLQPLDSELNVGWASTLETNKQYQHPKTL